MNILMMTNAYLPHVGGVAQSVHRFTQAYQAKGHETLVVAPEFEGAEKSEDGVVRVPAVQNFNGSDFSVMVPVPFYLTKHLNRFSPEVVHSHHPFLLGDTALRVAASREAPLVFTHHTLYEHYTHYVPLEADSLRAFVIKLCTGYANQCDHVIAPSESVKNLIRERGVSVPVTVIPTGVDFERFSQGDGSAFRQQAELDADDFVVGHVGRLAPEKNLEFLAESVARFLKGRENARFLVAGYGPSGEVMEGIFQDNGVMDQVRFAGKLADQQLVNAYHAMDVFAFSSKSETQGMVLVEAMAAGTPVVALEASGVRDVVRHEENGWVVGTEDESAFIQGLEWVAHAGADLREKLLETARKTGRDLSTERCAERALEVYREASDANRREIDPDAAEWDGLMKTLEQEWNIWANRLAAASTMVQNSGATKTKDDGATG